MKKGTKVIYNNGTEENPEWINHTIDGTESKKFLKNISFIEVDKETGEDIIES